MVRKRIARTIPFGYKASEEDEKLLEPVEKEQAVIEQARKYYEEKSASLRDLIAWIEENTGRKLTPRGLTKILKRGW